jgi:hypothetical protein
MAPASGSPIDGAMLAAEALEDMSLPFSTIVVLSAAPRDPGQASDEQLARALSASGARLYVVANRRGEREQTQLDILEQLGTQSGGQYIGIYSAASFDPAVARLADRMNGELLLEYLEPDGTQPPGDVRVGIRRPGARVQGLGIRTP